MNEPSSKTSRSEKENAKNNAATCENRDARGDEQQKEAKAVEYAKKLRQRIKLEIVFDKSSKEINFKNDELQKEAKANEYPRKLQKERTRQQIKFKIQEECEPRKMKATNRITEESRREAEKREQQRQDDLGSREKEEEERRKRQEEEREKRRAKQLDEHKNRLKEMDDDLQSEKEALRNMRRDASEEIRRLQQTTLNLAHQRGKVNAAKIFGAMRLTYEHGVRDGFLHFQNKIEDAITKENGAVLVHDGSEEAKSITDKLLQLLEKRSFDVPEPVRENDEMPPYNGKCRLKWLVFYIALRQDSSANHIGDTILRAGDYLKKPAFHACQKLFILQTNTENLSKADALTTLDCLENTKAIVACIPNYHCAVVEKLLKRNTRFDDVVNELMVDAKSREECVIKN